MHDDNHDFKHHGNDGHCAALPDHAAGHLVKRLVPLPLLLLIALMVCACGTGPRPASRKHPTIVPRVAAAPSAHPDPSVGQTLNTTTGTWTGNPTSYVYQWQRCAPSCSDIAFAVNPTYTVQSADLGDTIQVIVTATNAHGSASQASAQTTTVTATTCPSSTANVPDGPDPWGGCFPGPLTTGVPAGTTLTTVSTNGETAAQAVAAGAPADNTGWTYQTNGTGQSGITITTSGAAVVDQISSDQVYDDQAGPTTIKNSSLSNIGGVIVSGNLTNGLITVTHTTLNAGNQANVGYCCSVSTGNVDLQYVDASGGKDGYNCEGGTHCYAENSYIHDMYSGNSLAHQQAYDMDGGNDIHLQHDTLHCYQPSTCTADITVSTDFADTNMTFMNNLFVAGAIVQNGFCVYPGPQASGISVALYNIHVTDNVFQRGASGKCGATDWAYGWFPSRCETTTQGAPPSTALNTSCSWTGNVTDAGASITYPFQ